MPEANRGDLFNILNTHWFDPRNAIRADSELGPDEPPPNLAIIFTENPETANSSFNVRRALAPRLLFAPPQPCRASRLRRCLAGTRRSARG